MKINQAPVSQKYHFMKIGLSLINIIIALLMKIVLSSSNFPCDLVSDDHFPINEFSAVIEFSTFWGLQPKCAL